MEENEVKDEGAAQKDVNTQIESLKADLTRLRADMAELVRDLLEVAKQEAGEVREKLGAETLKKVEELRAAAGSAKDRGRQSVEKLEQQVGEHPLLSLAAAFGVGFLVGKLMTRD